MPLGLGCLGGGEGALAFVLCFVGFPWFLYTPGSMNRLFGDLFRKFEGVILGTFGTIWGCLGEVLGEKLR